MANLPECEGKNCNELKYEIKEFKLISVVIKPNTQDEKSLKISDLSDNNREEWRKEPEDYLKKEYEKKGKKDSKKRCKGSCICVADEGKGSATKWIDAKHKLKLKDSNGDLYAIVTISYKKRIVTIIGKCMAIETKSTSIKK